MQGSENGRVVTIGKHSRLNRQIWYRHPNSEAGNDEIQNFQREDFILYCRKLIELFNTNKACVIMAEIMYRFQLDRQDSTELKVFHCFGNTTNHNVKQNPLHK
jgi:hypothetical protein